MTQLTIALAKGRLLNPTIKLFESLGYDLRPARDSRKLVIDDAANNVRFLIAKPMDVPTYVEYGAADVGVVGQDALFESGVNVYEPLVLGYGACRLIVAGKPELRDGASRGTVGANPNTISPHDAAPDAEWRLLAGLRVATKYPRSVQKHFSARGLSVEIIALYGSIELAPMVGLADLIVDVVDTGRTLRENGLVELDEIFKSQAAFIVNRAAHTLRVNEIRGLIEKIQVDRRDAENAEGNKK
jgi:ATP phosphoribosyltransferase